MDLVLHSESEYFDETERLPFIYASRLFHSLLHDYYDFRLFFADHMKNWSFVQKKLWNNLDFLTIDCVRASGDRRRSKFVEGMTIGAPKHFRVIDCRSTIEEQRVTLVDWYGIKAPYTAISHTFGRNVYSVFDCECASKCFAAVPRCTSNPCPGHGDAHSKIMADVLNMCIWLRGAGAEYLWHDGVCIAQHNEAEVNDTIKHMGWIYGHAKETVIFLHYIGNPMAPIRHDGDLVSRWNSRVWTLQEAALSARRKYCVRVGGDLSHCQDLQEFEEEIRRWYEDDSTIKVIEEDDFISLLRRLSNTLVFVGNHRRGISYDQMLKCFDWTQSLTYLISTCMDTCVQFPTLETALSLCSTRKSKHEGDRINSILALAGVMDFVAPKNGNLKTLTIEFFKRQGQKGLGRAVFSVNLQGGKGEEDFWVPDLSRQLQPIQTDSLQTLHPPRTNVILGSGDFIQYEVLEKDMVQMSADPLVCVRIRFHFMRRDLIGGNASDPSVARETEGSVLRMDLAYEPGFNFMAFAEGSRVAMGKAAFQIYDHRPVFKGNPLNDGEMVHVRMVYADRALRLARRTRLIDLRRSTHSATKSRRGNQNHLLGPPPKFVSSYDPIWKSLKPDLQSVPALLVNDAGDSTVVSKLGHMYMYPSLQDILLTNSSVKPTLLQKIVIR